MAWFYKKEYSPFMVFSAVVLLQTLCAVDINHKLTFAIDWNLDSNSTHIL